MQFQQSRLGWKIGEKGGGTVAATCSPCGFCSELCFQPLCGLCGAGLVRGLGHGRLLQPRRLRHASTRGEVTVADVYCTENTYNLENGHARQVRDYSYQVELFLDCGLASTLLHINDRSMPFPDSITRKCLSVDVAAFKVRACPARRGWCDLLHSANVRLA